MVVIVDMVIMPVIVPIVVPVMVIVPPPITILHKCVVDAAVPGRPPVTAGTGAGIPRTIATAADDRAIGDAGPAITGSTGATIRSNQITGSELLTATALTWSNAIARAQLLSTTSGSWPIDDPGNITSSRPTGPRSIGTSDLSRQRRSRRRLLHSAERRTLSGPRGHTRAIHVARPGCRAQIAGRLYFWTIRHAGTLSTRADAAGTCRSNIRLRGPRHVGTGARLAKASH
jgi:hypothetical protein